MRVPKASTLNRNRNRDLPPERQEIKIKITIKKNPATQALNPAVPSGVREAGSAQQESITPHSLYLTAFLLASRPDEQPHANLLH